MRLRLLFIVVVLARLSSAQTPDTSHRGATISGIVHDSIARLPLAGAIVQLVAAENPASVAHTAVSDSVGRFALVQVPNGHFMLGFFHPMLDSLGVEAPLREVFVDGGQSVRADLAIPSPARLRATICGKRPDSVAGGVVVGVVRDARNGAPASGVAVSGEWLEFSFTRNGLVRRVPHLVATTADNGWFAMCNVPTGGTMALIASRGADSTDLLEVQVPADGFLRHELYLGAATTVTFADTAPASEATARRTRRVRAGDGRLSGTVVAAVGGRALAGAQVSIVDGPQTRANERGEWTLADAPAGTRMLEVRALGYYPDRRRVHVVAGAPQVSVALSTLKAVLDTVKISANVARYERYRNGFLQRQRVGVGRFLTVEDIARRQPIATSDLLRMVPGITVEYDVAAVDKQILMRGSFGLCAPAIYLDDHHMGTLSAEDIDVWVHPKEVAGIEIYVEGTVPPQFQPGLGGGGCGSIVIWTK
jgi:hypothetical protein